ncbi:MAG: pyridoxamine 5'-phosphate oxidase family protein [Clostridia bacterium]|nr:pyridoxamine 5'-phosphate oxidase family protein [Clostridia bacterium]
MTKDEIQSLVDRSLFADLGFLTENGAPAVRRVFCTWHKGLARHMISTNTSSCHVKRLKENPVCCLYFSDTESFEGACFSGRAVIRQDAEARLLLWHEEDVQYYPLGVDDPDYCVIELIADSCAFYRFDGKGVLTSGEMEEFDADAQYRDGYSEWQRKGGVSPD